MGWPAVGLNVPGAQSVAAWLPTLQKVPLGQLTHWVALLITATLEGTCVPAGHGNAAAAPVTQ